MNESKRSESPPHHVYAIVRVDEFQGSEVPLERKITVKKIVSTQAEAQAEVDRLNHLQAERGVNSIYFCQVTRFEKEAEATASAAGRSSPELGRAAG